MKHAARVPTVADRLADLAASVFGASQSAVQSDAEKLVEQMRALGIDKQMQAEYLQASAMFAAIGTPPRAIVALAKAAAAGRFTNEEAHILRENGITMMHDLCDDAAHQRERISLKRVRWIAARWENFGSAESLSAKIFEEVGAALNHRLTVSGVHHVLDYTNHQSARVRVCAVCYENWPCSKYQDQAESGRAAE